MTFSTLSIQISPRLFEIFAPPLVPLAFALYTQWEDYLWTRPDSFIYISFFAIAVLFFNQASNDRQNAWGVRPHEIAAVAKIHPQLLENDYVRVCEFNVRDRVSQLNIHRRDYLAFDSQFTVFCKRH